MVGRHGMSNVDTRRCSDQDAHEANEGVESIEAVRAALCDWYASNRRDLPFRDVADPYAVLVSEVMLQQTQVARVVPFYLAWMEAFPDVAALAAAPREAVLMRWQGLGYYARARNLHRAAAEIVARHGGRVPDDVDDLLALPGIGAYTAGAVASIAFGRRVPAVDGNVRRVLARLMALREDPASADGARQIGALAAAIADGPAPGELNQALMELGATVCRPRDPRCADCPLTAHCAAFAAGVQHEIPFRRPTKPRARRRALAWRIERPEDGRILVARRPEHGLLGGLWEFPLVDLPEDIDEADEAVEIDETDVGHPFAATHRPDSVPLGLAIERVERGDDVRHIFSHLELVVTTCRAVVRSGARLPAGIREGGAEYVIGAGDGVDGIETRDWDGIDVRPGDRTAVGMDGAQSGGTGDRIGGIDIRTGGIHRYDAYRWIEPADLAGLPRSSLMEKVERAIG